MEQQGLKGSRRDILDRGSRNRIGSRSLQRTSPGLECVISYFCIVNLPGAPDQDIYVLDAADDAAALRGLARVAARWPGFETLSLYHGERIVRVQGNPHWGLTSVEDRDLLDGVLSIAA